MPGQTEMARGRLAKRLITFYTIMAVIGVAVVVFVISKGGSEKAQPAIAGGYVASSAAPCIGPVPKPAGGTPLPATACRDRKAVVLPGRAADTPPGSQ